MKHLSRRDFSKRAALTTASIYAGIATGTTSARMMGGGGGPVTTINPPVGAPLKDPVTIPNLSTTSGIVEVAVESKIAPVNINGTTANLVTYNGHFPGGTIRAKKGRSLEVKIHKFPSE